MNKISQNFHQKQVDILPNECRHPHKFYSSKPSPKILKNSKFLISPKKEECKNNILSNEKTFIIYSVRRNNKKRKREKILNLECKPLCRKLDFSECSENNSNYTVSDNESIDINEDLSEESYSLMSTGDGKKIKKSKTDKDLYIEKELTFIKKRQNNFDELSFGSNNSKFEEEYVIIKTLCNGEMGTVYLCFRIKDKKRYVVKMSKYFSRKLDYDNMNNFVNDIKMNLYEPACFFIQKYIDFWIEDIYDKNNKGIANTKNMYIVTDYCTNGNLKEYLMRLKKDNKFKLNYSFLWDIIFQMIIPINFLHKLGYIHFDIKPTNYLVMDNNQLLLNDFCLSIKEKNIKAMLTDEFEGDSIYISPELFYKDIGIITHKIDIFSLGLSILELIADIELPKNGPVWRKIRNESIPKEFTDKIPVLNKDFDNQKKIIELITEMSQVNSKLRPELESIINNNEKYPELYKRNQMLKNNIYLKNLYINNINKEKNEKEIKDKEISNDNINKFFLKRSDSMEFVTQNSTSENDSEK